MVLLETEKTSCPHNKIWSREAKSLHPILSQPNATCSSCEETAPGLAGEMSCLYKESQEGAGRLLIAKGLGWGTENCNGHLGAARSNCGSAVCAHPNSQLGCSPPGYPAVLEHFSMLDFCFFSFARLKSCMKAFGDVLAIGRAVSVLGWCMDGMAGGFC